jgi:ABC-type multidrug transport system fused ATPase/permease subunit
MEILKFDLFLVFLRNKTALNSITLRLLDRLTQRENEAKDARTKRTTESIKNMKLLKVQAWEDLFADDIRQHRRDELSRHKSRGMIRSFNSAISNCVPSLVLVVTLTAYAKTGKPIVASTIFTAISLFNQLRFPLFFYPMLIDSLANGKNSLRRISSYLTSEELTPYMEKYPTTMNGGSIEVKSGNFLWPGSDIPKDGQLSSPDSPALCNVNLKVNPGEVVAVVGSVGSGKSALLQALLGELAPVPRMVVDSSGNPRDVEAGELIDRPSVSAYGNVAYCSQEAWIQKGTVRDAVVFGREYNEARYSAAIYDAGLDTDIATGVFGHDTDVGEGGSSLSGGQRARVALARALYSGEDTKIFLFDDCLAALDASVGSLVFERMKKRLRSSNAATVLVTNDPSLPRRCDRVVLMGPTNRSGTASSCSTIVDVGTYDELLSRGHKLTSISATVESAEEEAVGASADTLSHEPEQQVEDFESKKEMIRVVGGYKVHANTTDLSGHADCDHQEVDLQNNPDLIADRASHVDPEGEVINSELYTVQDSSKNADGQSQKNTSAEPATRASKLISADDKMSTKSVPFSTYVNYLEAVRSPKLIFAMAMAFVATNGVQFFQQFTVAKWTEVAHGNTMAAALGTQYLSSLVYAAGAVSVFLWFRSYFTMLVGLRASDFYHDRMVSSVFLAPMSFFDATPSGQVLSRFGKEMETIDRALPESFASVLFCGLQISSSVLALAGAVTPTMIIPIMFAGNLYYKTMKRFRRAARDMKRSETKTRSPIFTHFGEALRGTATIRSIPGASRTWSSAHRSLSDANLSIFSTVKALDRWLSTRLEALGNFLVLSTALACVYLCRTGSLLPGKAGWGLTQSLAITG